MKRNVPSIWLSLSLSLATGLMADAGEEIKIMIWNVERGSNHFENGPEKALKVIQDAGVDLVLLQESYDIDGERPKLGAWLAEQLSWNQYQGKSAHLCILTQHEIKKTYWHTSWNAIGAKIKTPESEFLAWSCWIDYKAGLTQYLRNTENPTIEGALKCESELSTRTRDSAGIMKTLKGHGHLNSDLPLLVGGDWNSPSHLDLTEKTKHRNGGLIIPVPTSILFEKNGFIDAYRTVYPDEFKHPGYTWSPLHQKSKDFARIDRLYIKADANLKVKASHTLPIVWEAPAIPKKKRTFPSDHAALVVTIMLPQNTGDQAKEGK